MRLVEAATAALYLPFLLVSFHLNCGASDAFSPRLPPLSPHNQYQRREFDTDNSATLPTSPLASRLPSLSLSVTIKDADEGDCGCATPTEFSGKPSAKARDMTDHRTVISSLPLFKVDGSGDSTNLDHIIGHPVAQGSKVSIVVFLRSLG